MLVEVYIKHDFDPINYLVPIKGPGLTDWDGRGCDHFKFVNESNKCFDFGNEKLKAIIEYKPIHNHIHGFFDMATHIITNFIDDEKNINDDYLELKEPSCHPFHEVICTLLSNDKGTLSVHYKF